MGNGRKHRRFARLLAVALVLAAAGAFGQAQSAEASDRKDPQITSLTHATTNAITVNWLGSDKATVHWIYSVKTDGSGGKFQLAVADPPPSQGASGQSTPVTEVSTATTVTGLAANTQYWFAVLGILAPSEDSPNKWFRWSNWARGTTLVVPTVSLSSSVAVAEGGTATFTVTAAPAPSSALTANYAIGADNDATTVDGDSNDYTGPATGSVSIAAGATQGTISVAIADDSDIDDGAQEILVVTISLPSGSSYLLGTNSSATVTITEGVCDRTAAVSTAILAKLSDVSACAQVTDAGLRGITGKLDLSGKSLTALKARDFRGLSGLQKLHLNKNSLTALPANVFVGLTSLTELRLNKNSLAALPDNVFSGLTRLADLRLQKNALAALPADVFQGITGLTKLQLESNTGSPFTFTATVEQTAATQAKVVVDEATPFNLTATLAVTGGALSTSSVVVPAGGGESPALTVTPSGDAPVTVRISAARFPTSGVTYSGIQTGVGALNQAPTASAGADQTVDTGTTVTLDASGSSDPDSGDMLSYAWGQTAGGTVTLSSATASQPTFTAPASAATLTFRVTAMDGKGGSDRDTVDITVIANQPPTFTSNATFSVAENATAVGTVIATDANSTDSITAYALSGTDAALFAITSAGVLTFKAAPDFEAPKGGANDDSNTYTFTVTATGGAGARALTATQNLTVSVTNVNEAPAFTSNAAFSLAENITAVGTVTATDPDGADSVTSFALSGTDAALFQITSAGVLTFKAAPDFEAPKGGANDNSNSYALTVTGTGGAGDRALTATQDLTVSVTDANEAPAITSSATFSLAENTTAVGTVTAADPDAADSVTGYSLSGTDAALFQITSAGVLTFKAAPDFEAPKGGANDDSNTYTFTVTVTGGAGDRALTAAQTLTVSVTDANETPTFTSSPTFSLAENTTAVGTVAATDPDATDSVTGYSLSGTDAALFAITSAGVLTFKAAPNFEAPKGGTNDDSNSYALTVTVTGGAGDRALTATQDLTVSVTDANEAPAITSSATFSLAENTTAVGTVTASDPDATDSIASYTLSGTDATLFAITSAGALTFKSAPDFEAPKGGANDDSNSYALTVTATGGADARALTATQDLTVTVTNVNELPGAPRNVFSDNYENGEHFGTDRWKIWWDPPSSNGGSAITGYQIQRRERTTGPWTDWVTTANVDGDTTEVMNYGVFNRRYQNRVRALNSEGYGPWTVGNQFDNT